MKNTDWLVSTLSEEQKQVIGQPSSNTAILASAGSGKTRTLVHLLARDLLAGVPPTGIIAFTFTEKASEELLTRIHMLLRQNAPDLSLEGMFIGTIHSWCFHYLLKQSDFYNFTSMDELHNDSLVSRLYDYLDLENTYRLPYPRGISIFLADIEVYYNENLTDTDIPSNVRESLNRFFDLIQQNRLLTFGSMIRSTVDYLHTNGYVSGLESLFVDEYQDVNPAQVSLIKAMIPDGGKVSVVGDELQCIYNWRGSDVKRILDFQNEFTDATVKRLVSNYRSRPPIVRLANTIAANITFRDTQKDMESGRKEVEPSIINWISSESEEQQALAIVEIIERFRSEGVSLNQIAILVRSVTRWGRSIVDALSARGIPVQCPILSRGGEFIDEFILPLLDWLRKDHQDPKNESEEIAIEEMATNLEISLRKWISSSVATQDIWAGINDWLDSIIENSDTAYNVRERLYDFLNRCQVWIEPDDHNLMIGVGITSQIIRSVEEIHRRRLIGHRRVTPRRIMSEVYFTLKRKQQEFGESAPIDTHIDGVLVTTVHQAKGLEWPIVIIPMLNTGCFPVRSRRHESSFPGNITQRYGTTLDDERRLFYVATTRAKERLFLLDTMLSNSDRRSIFLKEINQNKHLYPSTLKDIDANVWKIDPEDLTESEPPPLRIGLSDLLIYNECPYQYGLRRITEIQPSVGEELGYGMGLHELIQRRFDEGDKWDPQVLTEKVINHVNLPYMSEKGEQIARTSIENHLNQLENLGAFSSQTAPELEVEIIMARGIIHGIIDGVEIIDDTSVIIRDWKSNVHDKFMNRYAKQLQFYAHALRIQGKAVVKAEIVDVARSAKENRIVNYAIDISEKTVAELMNSLDSGINGIIENTYTPSPDDNACGCCDIYQICGKRAR
ncbi:ATP-dependent helicase [Chloroflexota bacterium]